METVVVMDSEKRKQMEQEMRIQIKNQAVHMFNTGFVQKKCWIEYHLYLLYNRPLVFVARSLWGLYIWIMGGTFFSNPSWSSLKGIIIITILACFAYSFLMHIVLDWGAVEKARYKREKESDLLRMATKPFDNIIESVLKTYADDMSLSDPGFIRYDWYRFTEKIKDEEDFILTKIDKMLIRLAQIDVNATSTQC